MYLVFFAILSTCACFVNGQGSSDCATQMTAYPPDPSTECCGVDSRFGDKIFGGNETAIDEYPWLVVIEYVQGVKTKLLCGGSLISGRYILTAGHCVVGPILNYGTPKRVRLGEHNTSHEGPDCAPVIPTGFDCNEGVTRILIEKLIPHPEYDPYNLKKRHDIALIRLAEKAPFTDFIRPICLPKIDVTEPQNIPKNFTLYTAGWGAISETIRVSKVKIHVDVPYVSPEDCQPAYNVPRRHLTLGKSQMCAGGVKGKDSCKGDSGGPLMYIDRRSHQVIGVVSFGAEHCGLEDVPGVYSKVYDYLDWIKSTIVA